MRESGTEGISALLSDVMNIKNGSEFSFIKNVKILVGEFSEQQFLLLLNL